MSLKRKMQRTLVRSAQPQVERVPLSDKGKLQWREFADAMDGARALLDRAYSSTAARVLELEGKRVENGWRLDVSTMEAFRMKEPKAVR
jgi:hypothetical protein